MSRLLLKDEGVDGVYLAACIDGVDDVFEAKGLDGLTMLDIFTTCITGTSTMLKRAKHVPTISRLKCHGSTRGSFHSAECPASGSPTFPQLAARIDPRRRGDPLIQGLVPPVCRLHRCV